MGAPWTIRRLEALEPPARADLIELLVAVVDDGASVGFLPPMDPGEAARYWDGVLSPARRLFVAERDGRVDGTVQLTLETRPNGNHRGEIGKLLVHPRARRQGLGRRLMLHAEAAARAEGRSLLVLDTREGDVSNELYRSLGWQLVGRVPRYARGENNRLDATMIYYREL